MVRINGDNYKAIVSDFDGTLVGKELVIPEQVTEAIRKIVKHGIEFIIASGRSYNGLVENTCKELHLTSPQITRGGSEIIDPANGKIIYAENIPDNDSKRLITILKGRNISFWVEKGKSVYTDDGIPLREFGPVPFKKFHQLEVSSIPKLGIFAMENEQIEQEVEDVLKKEFSTLHITKSFSPVGRVWDITAVMANKQEAVVEVAKLLKLERSEIIGIGDGYNDFPLLEACGYKVAMGNANKELKAIADKTLPSYQENGVAVFLNELLLSDGRS